MRLNRLSSPRLFNYDTTVTKALVTKMGFVPIPRYIPHQEYWLAMTAYLVLMVGNLVRGL